jgi:hypothetical protein
LDVDSFPLILIAYTGAGIAVYVALYRWFRKADFPGLSTDPGSLPTV